MWKRILLIVLAAGGAYQYWGSGGGGPVSTDIGEDFPLDLSQPLGLANEPLQQSIDAPDGPYHFTDYRLRPLASLQLAARVLAIKWYRSGREAELSPVDFALGWDPMAEEEVLRELEISQSGRYYRWRVERFPVPRRTIETHSANMHLIPATAEVSDALSTVDVGDRVHLHGYLVRVDADDGWRWLSSLTREDTGAHACELVLVQHLEVH